MVFGMLILQKFRYIYNCLQFFKMFLKFFFIFLKFFYKFERVVGQIRNDQI